MTPMEGEGSIWGLLLFLFVVAGFAAWKSGALKKLSDNLKDASKQ